MYQGLIKRLGKIEEAVITYIMFDKL